MNSFNKIRNNKSGIIIIIVIWILTILMLLVTGLGRRTNIELKLAKHAMSKGQAKALGLAGLLYAVDLIRQDMENEESVEKDTLYYCGIPIKEDLSTEDVFVKQEFDSGYFEIQYREACPKEGEDVRIFPGFEDEERKVNINGLLHHNVEVFAQLLMALDVEEQEAFKIAYSALDWKDENGDVNNDSYGAEDDYYRGLGKPYHCKNALFDSKEEIMLVRGMTGEIYKDIKEYITVYPKNAGLKVNFDTASKNVLLALTRKAVGSYSNTSLDDANSLTEKMLGLRAGDDGEEFTEDDRRIEMNDMALNDNERIVFLAIQQYRTDRSNYFRVRVRGVQESRDIITNIEAVVARQDLSIVEYRRN